MFNRQGKSLELYTYLKHNKKNKILTGTCHILHLWGDNNRQKTNFEDAIRDFQSDPLFKNLFYWKTHPASSMSLFYRPVRIWPNFSQERKLCFFSFIVLYFDFGYLFILSFWVLFLISYKISRPSKYKYNIKYSIKLSSSLFATF